ncbi:MAG: endonuclease/exonuclease/phosphatase family protein [Acetobacteraceae bacterium]|nr:endonuclease/exonuclease/phosphatase family protein [Acetobacteraceae bacterium]
MISVGEAVGWVLRVALLIAALVLLILTLLPISHADTWWIRYAMYPALQFAGLMLAIALLLLIWRGVIEWIAIAGLLVGISIQVSRLAPYLAPLVVNVPAPTVTDGNCGTANRVRLLEVNVQRTNRHDHALLNIVRHVDPDIAWFQEVDDWWESELSALDPSMPYGLLDVQPNYFGVHLYSKLPLTDTSTQDLTNSNNPSIFATATLPSGDRLRIYAVHPRPPQVGQSAAERDAQLMATALAAHGDTEAHLVAGDLNAVPWDDILRRVETIGRVADPRVGRGLFITWNANRTFAKWPLDHLLPGPGITLSRLEVLPPFGSDHRPLLADFCVAKPAASPQPLDPAVKQAAEAVVVHGQGKARSPGAATPEGSETHEDRPN